MSLVDLRQELQNLDWRRPEQWTPLMRRLLAAAAGLMMLMLVSLGLLLPRVNELSEFRDQQQQAQQTLRELQQALLPLRQEAQQQAAVRDLHAKLWSQSSGENADLSLLRALATLRDRHGLLDQGYEPQKPVEAGPYSVSALRLRLRGSYHALAGFLSDLAALPQIVLVESLELSRDASAATDPTSGLTITLGLRAYRLGEQEPIREGPASEQRP